MQDIREPTRASIGKSAIANKWAWNWSYLRLQFQHFPHEPDIMPFPSPLLKHNSFLGVPPIFRDLQNPRLRICLLWALTCLYIRDVFPFPTHRMTAECPPHIMKT